MGELPYLSERETILFKWEDPPFIFFLGDLNVGFLVRWLGKILRDTHYVKTSCMTLSFMCVYVKIF